MILLQIFWNIKKLSDYFFLKMNNFRELRYNYSDQLQSLKFDCG